MYRKRGEDGCMHVIGYCNSPLNNKNIDYHHPMFFYRIGFPCKSPCQLCDCCCFWFVLGFIFFTIRILLCLCFCFLKSGIKAQSWRIKERRRREFNRWIVDHVNRVEPSGVGRLRMSFITLLQVVFFANGESLVWGMDDEVLSVCCVSPPIFT